MDIRQLAWWRAFSGESANASVFNVSDPASLCRADCNWQALLVIEILHFPSRLFHYTPGSSSHCERVPRVLCSRHRTGDRVVLMVTEIVLCLWLYITGHQSFLAYDEASVEPRFIILRSPGWGWICYILKKRGKQLLANAFAKQPNAFALQRHSHKNKKVYFSTRSIYLLTFFFFGYVAAQGRFIPL